MAEDLAQLHEIAAACLAALEAPARTRLLRRMSGDIRRVQQRRMAAQR
ncbi:MAG TPA: phage virion morphogenesis protein, partial [Brevundimonas sp.]|nr:phage virion morphogenesis protein [Brevundimonas sp.]